MTAQCRWSALLCLCGVVASDVASAVAFSTGIAPLQDCGGATGSLALDGGVAAFLEPLSPLRAAEYGGSDYHPAMGSNLGIATGYASATAHVSQWCIGLFYRSEFEGRASKDLLDAWSANRQNRPFDSGRLYSLSLDDRTFSARGLGVGRVWHLGSSNDHGTRFALVVSYLRGVQITEQTLNGQVRATSPDLGVGTAQWLRTGTDLGGSGFNPFVSSGAPQGDGFTADLEMSNTATNGLFTDLLVTDVIGWIAWRNVPRSLRLLNNQSIHYNINLDRDASITGIDSIASVRSNIRAKVHGLVRIPMIAGVAAEVADDVIDGYHFPTVGMFTARGSSTTTIELDLRTHALGLRQQFHKVSFSMASNRIDFSTATALAVSVRASLAW